MIAIAKSSAIASAQTSSDRSQTSSHDLFLALLPRIRRNAQFAFRHLDREERDEATQAAVVHAWTAYERLVRLGKENVAYAVPLARYAVARVRDGRPVGSRLGSRDILSERGRRRRGACLERLDQHDGRFDWKEIVVEDRHAGPAAVATMRVDFDSWLATLSGCDRRVAEVLATGETTLLTAKRFDVAPSRISQLRRKLYILWMQFQGELGVTARATPTCA